MCENFQCWQSIVGRFCEQRFGERCWVLAPSPQNSHQIITAQNGWSVLGMPTERLPPYALFSEVGSGWRCLVDDVREKYKVDCLFLVAVRLPSQGPRDSQKRWLKRVHGTVGQTQKPARRCKVNNWSIGPNQLDLLDPYHRDVRHLLYCTSHFTSFVKLHVAFTIVRASVNGCSSRVTYSPINAVYDIWYAVTEHSQDRQSVLGFFRADCLLGHSIPILGILHHYRRSETLKR